MKTLQVWPTHHSLSHRNRKRPQGEILAKSTSLGGQIIANNTKVLSRKRKLSLGEISGVIWGNLKVIWPPTYCPSPTPNESQVACGILIPWSGIEARPMTLKTGILTTDGQEICFNLWSNTTNVQVMKWRISIYMPTHTFLLNKENVLV